MPAYTFETNQYAGTPKRSVRLSCVSDLLHVPTDGATTADHVVTAQMVAKVVWNCDVRLAPEACCDDIAEEKLRAHHEYDSFIRLRLRGLWCRLDGGETRRKEM
jgi:hypothetical protein